MFYTVRKLILGSVIKRKTIHVTRGTYHTKNICGKSKQEEKQVFYSNIGKDNRTLGAVVISIWHIPLINTPHHPKFLSINCGS